jgi:glycosyltransferase involved in cell wall biosynthesis
MSKFGYSVDVIIPTFNSNDLLGRAIDSCLKQTYSINKIIIVDDGSNQTSQEYLSELQGIHNKLEVIFNTHTGLPAIGRSIGISHSKADWIAFLDSDDYWSPEKIERQIKIALDSGADFVYTNAYILKTDNSLELFHDDLPLDLKLETLLKTNWIVNSSAIMKRNLFDIETPYATSSRVRAVEDYATWLRLVTRYKFVGIAEPLTFYQDSISSIRSSDTTDPRIFAIADFISWCSCMHSQSGYPRKATIRKAFKVLKGQYLK